MTERDRSYERERRYFGKYRGKVTDRDDPKNLGRVKARVYEVLGDVETGWALPCAPYAGENQGLFAIPPVDAAVWIEFEAGDLSRPIWSGCFWGDDQRPADAAGTKAAPAVKILRSEGGLMVSLDDDGKTVTVSDEGGDNSVVIDVNGGKITVKASTKIVVEAPAIELVDGASHAVVFGDSLLQYLNQVVSSYASHTHPGQTAGPYPVAPTPPTPSLPSASSSLLSTKVKAG
jgi:uncharacterized protein involved in type VI secretion and phage assembly